MIRQFVAFAMLLLVALVGFNVGCKTGASDKSDALTQDRQHPPFFKNIPADTAYVLASSEPMPWDVMESFYKKGAGFYASLFEDLDVSVEDTADPVERFFLALIEEFTTNMSKEGLEELGFSVNARFAFYSVGVLPVLRMELGDPTAFEAFITRVESRSGFAAEKKSLEGVEYRYYGDGEASFIVAITEGQVVFGGAFGESLAIYLPYMLGTQLPEKSFAHSNPLKSLNERYGFLPFFSGYLDQQELLRIALGRTENTLATRIWDAMDMGPMNAPVECQDEISALVAHAPRSVVGYTEFTRESFGMRMGLEFTNDFAKRLSGTRAPIPAYDASSPNESVAMFGVGVDLAKLAEFARDLAVQVQASPFRCSDLSWMNEVALQLQFAPDQIPPFLSQVRGFMAVISELEMTEEQTMKLAAAALLQTGEPETLFGVMQMLVPFMQNVSVESNGVPTALPADLGLPLVDVPHIAMSSTALGFSTGVGMQDRLATMLEQPLAATTPMVVLSYNYATIMDRVSALFGGGMSFNDALSPLTDMFGNLVITLDADDSAVFMHYDAQFKP